MHEEPALLDRLSPVVRMGHGEETGELTAFRARQRSSLGFAEDRHVSELLSRGPW